MTRKSLYLMTGVAVTALVAAAPGAFAQAIDQATTNYGTVNNNGATTTDPNTIGISFNGGTPGIGIGASASIGATGAVSSVSTTAVNQDFVSPPMGTITQGALNHGSGTVQNNGTVTIGNGSTSAGSSASVSASGAVAAVSIMGIGDTTGSPTLSGQTVGNISQGTDANHLVSNGADITNVGEISAAGLSMSGAGSSASVSATGAVASVSVASIDVKSFGANNIAATGTVDQTVLNSGVISNTSGTVGASPVAGITVGAVGGDGASVSVGATGAAASISVASIGSTDVASTTFGTITQNSTNGAAGVLVNVTNTGNISTGDVGGVGAGAQISATGATSSVSVSSIGNDTTPTLGGGGVGQTTNNNGAITNSGIIASSGTLSGAGSSASISAVGAASSFSVSSINDTAVASLMPGNITQTTNNNLGSAVHNTGAITLSSGSMGTAASAGISATGAGSFVSFRSVK